MVLSAYPNHDVRVDDGDAGGLEEAGHGALPRGDPARQADQSHLKFCLDKNDLEPVGISPCVLPLSHWGYNSIKSKSENKWSRRDAKSTWSSVNKCSSGQGKVGRRIERGNSPAWRSRRAALLKYYRVKEWVIYLAISREIPRPPAARLLLVAQPLRSKPLRRRFASSPASRRRQVR